MSKLLDIEIKFREDGEWNVYPTASFLSGRRVVVFGLPGAFTPTCSTYQLPGFEENYSTIRELGIDEVWCVSVNDAFVMNAWAKDQNIEWVKMLPDGNGEFTDALGMLVDKSNLGFGKRSWRYAMILNDGNIERAFIEDGKTDNCESDPYEVSTPENVITYLKETNK